MYLPFTGRNKTRHNLWIFIVILADVLFASQVNSADQPVTDQQLISVLNPTGYPPAIERKAMAERQRSLNGRTIYMVDMTFDNGDVFLKEMQKWFARNMPGVKTIFRAKKGAYYADDPDLWAEIKAAHGVAIMAIGH